MTEYIVKCNELTTVTPIGNKLQFPDYIDYNQEVVRCRDCRHFTPKGTHKIENGKTNADYCKYVRGWMLQITPDGYCKWGERRDADKRSTSKERAIKGVLMYLIDSSNTVEFDAMTAIEKATRDIMEIMGGDGAC